MEKEIDTICTPEIVCPHCGTEQKDSWENFNEDSGDDIEVDCRECDKSFTVSRNVIVSYNSFKTENENGKET